MKSDGDSLEVRAVEEVMTLGIPWIETGVVGRREITTRVFFTGKPEGTWILAELPPRPYSEICGENILPLFNS